jgi:hypothetical protein
VAWNRSAVAARSAIAERREGRGQPGIVGEGGTTAGEQVDAAVLRLRSRAGLRLEPAMDVAAQARREGGVGGELGCRATANREREKVCAGPTRQPL